MVAPTKISRLDRVASAIVAALRVLPAAGDPGYPSPGELAARLAHILRACLGPMERLCLASAALTALDQGGCQALIEAAELDRRAEEWPLPGVDPDLYYRVCREHRPPPLTRAQKQRADAISFDNNPRETLAEAWAGASEQDRRDLVARATGRVGA